MNITHSSILSLVLGIASCIGAVGCSSTEEPAPEPAPGPGMGGSPEVEGCVGDACDSTTPCMEITCETGTECLVTGGVAACVDTDGCADITCDPGLECVDAVAPAEGHECVEEDGCAASDCTENETCIDTPSPESGFTCKPNHEVLWKLVPESSGSFESKLSQVSGSGLSTSIEAFGSTGYVITAATTNTAGYTLWGFKPTDSTVTYDTKLSQVSGSGLSTSIEAFGGGGYMVTATTTNTAGYTLWGFSH